MGQVSANRPIGIVGGAGRPRSDVIDRKVPLAAVELYAREGWGRFSFEAVARLAQVGKPALYLRYDSKAQLLIASVATLSRIDDEIDTGNLRSDLLQYVREAFDFRLSMLGTASLRLIADQLYYPELRILHRGLVEKKIDNARRMVERAKQRGELSVAVDTNILLESLDGAVANRVNDTKLEDRPRLVGLVDSYAEKLVHLLLNEQAADVDRIKA